MALTNKLSAIGDAIREKTGKSDLLTLDQMPTEIASIQGEGGSTGGETKYYQLIQSFEVEEESDTYAILAFEGVRVGNLLVAAFYIRGGSYTISDGWIDLGGSGTNIGTVKQRLCFCYKIATSTDERLTVTHPAAARMGIKGSEISGATSATLGQSVVAKDFGIDVTIPGKKAIYGAATISSKTSDAYWETNPVYLYACAEDLGAMWADTSRLFTIFSCQVEDINYRVEQTAHSTSTPTTDNIEFNYIILD